MWHWMPFTVSTPDSEPRRPFLIMSPFVRTPMVSSQTFEPPALRRLGVNLAAEDIAEAVWQQSQGAAVHRPISLQFSLLYWLGQITPAPLTRWMMALINRP